MDITELPTPSMRQDKTAKKYNFDKLIRTCIPNREAWEEEEEKDLLQGKPWFGDSPGIVPYCLPGGSFRHSPLRGIANK